MKLWSRGYARASLMGARDETQNPSLAAFTILKRRFGTRAITRVVGQVRKRRRPFHRGNPAPALVVAAASKLFGGLGKRFKAPSEKRAARVAPAMVASALAGNLTAARAIIERTTEAGIAKERAVWAGVAAQLTPKILGLVQKYSEQIPGVDKTSIESIADSALLRPFDGFAAEAEAATQVGARGAAAARRRAQEEERGERREERLTQAGALVGQALLGRGRRPGARRRRRRTSARAFTF